MNKRKILVIEDQFDLWKDFLLSIFNAREYCLIERDKIKILGISDIDLILCDYFLENGEHGDDWLKKNILNKDSEIPVVFWTSSMNPAVLKSTIIGSEVFFKKNLIVKDFKETIDRLITARRCQKRFPIYNSFFNQQIKNENNREILYNIYIQASRYLESFFGQSKYHAVFNAHGLIHIQRVIDNLADLLRNCLNKDGNLYFSEKEYMSVYVAALLHDLGMIPDEYTEEMEFKQFTDLRKKHCYRIFKLFYMNEIWEKIGLENKVVSSLTDLFLKRIAFITLYHDSEFPFIKFLENNTTGNNTTEKNIIEKIYDELNIEVSKTLLDSLKNDKNLLILSGLLALADKMDYGKTRTPVPPIRSSNLRGLYDEFEYIKNECVISCEVKKEEKLNKIIINYKYGGCFPLRNPEYFVGFVKNGFDDQGKLLAEGIQNATCHLIYNVFQKSWENIKNAFDCEIQFLKSLKMEFLPYSEFDYNDYNFELPKNNNLIRGRSDLDWQEKALIYHIFNPDKYGSLSLIKNKEGFSEDSVFYVEHIKIINPPNDKPIYEGQNKFLKIGNFNRIHKEVQNYKKIGVKYLAPTSIIGHIEEFKYLDKGGYLGSIIQDDNKQVISLAKFLTNSTEKLTKYIEKSFLIFYENIKPVNDKVGTLSFYRKLIGEREKSLDKFELSGRKIKAKESQDKFTTLLKKIEDNGKITLQASLIHGDFTFRNILKPSNNLVFIDFAESGWGHYFFDFAKMDHYLRFEYFHQRSINTVNKEEELMCGKYSKSKSPYDLAYLKIWKICGDNLKINGKDFIIQKYLAYAYMNLWSLPFKKGTIHLDFEERIGLFNLYYEGINELLNKHRFHC
jgi:hypothetical protein